MAIIDRRSYNFSLSRYKPPLLTSIEANFDSPKQLEWFHQNQSISTYSTVAYCFIIYVLHLYMKRRTRYVIRTYAIAWNFFLAAFSFCVVARIGPDIVHDIYYYGYEFVLCDSSWILQCPATGFWGTMFAFSKVLEFGDTIFVVLRKRGLTVLHLYHHISVVLAVFYMITKHIGPARLVPVVNGGVHCIMYTYFGIRVMGYKVPMWTSMMLTSLQILQMIYAIITLLQINQVTAEGRKCDLLFEDLGLAIFLATSYTILFGNFFYQSYIKKPKNKSLLKKEA